MRNLLRIAIPFVFAVLLSSPVLLLAQEETANASQPYYTERDPGKLQSGVESVSPSLKTIWNAETPDERMTLIAERLFRLSELGLYHSDWTKEQWLDRVKSVNEGSFVQGGKGTKIPLSKLNWREISGCLMAGEKTFQNFDQQMNALEGDAGVFLSSFSLVKENALENDIINTVSVIDGSFTRVAESALAYSDRCDPSYYKALRAQFEKDGIRIQGLSEVEE